MNPENRKNTRGGARVQKAEKPQREKKPKPQRTRKQKALRILYITITVIAALIVAGFILFNIFAAPPDVSGLATPKPQTTTVIDEHGNEVEIEIPGLAADRKKNFYTFLITGISGGNTDTMLLAAYDVPNQVLNVMSLPRDTYVNYNGRAVLLNSVYSRAGGKDGGMEALLKEVGELTGVTPDFYALMEWEAVGELVDAIGGVYFTVPFDMYCNDLSQGFIIDLEEGYQLLDGDKAMQLIRYRMNSIGDTGKMDYSYGYANGDLGRIETQQAFLTALIEKCLQPTVLLPNLLEYINIFQENVTTNLSVGNMAYFGKAAIGSLDMNNVTFTTLPWKAAGSHLLPDGSGIVEAINDGFNPYEQEITLRDLDLVTSAPGTSSSSSSSSSKPSTGTTSTPTPAESPEETPAESPAASPDGSTAPQTTPTPANTASPAQTPVQTPQSTPAVETTPTPAPVSTPTPAPTPAPPAESSGGDFGPGMEPIE